MKNKKGITLIALVVTIIVLLILSGVSITMLMGDDGIITQAQESKFKTELGVLKDDLALFITEKTIESSNFNKNTLVAGANSLSYNTMPDGEIGNIDTILPNMSKSLKDKIEIIKGQLLINTTNKREIEWAQEINIAVSPYDITEEGVLLSSENNLLLLDDEGGIVIPEKVTEIGEGAFANLEGLKKIVIPGTVKIIGKNAFRGNTTLEEIVIEYGVETIKESAFNGCSNLKRIVLPDSVTTLESSIFQNCTNLTNATLSNNITEISAYMFYGCRSLVDIQIPENVIKLGIECLGLCTSLSELYISKNVTIISKGALNSTDSLIPEVDSNNPNYTMIDNLLCTKDGKEVINVCKLRTLTELTIPEGIETINLDGASNLQKLIVSASVKSLSMGYGANSLTEVEISEDNEYYSSDDGAIYNKDKTILVRCIYQGETYTVIDSVKTLAEQSFQGKTNLKELVLSEEVEEFETLTIYVCKNLQKLYIGKNVTTMNGMSLYNTPSLTEVTINSENETFTVEDGKILTDDGSTLVKVLGNPESVTVPSTITKIGRSAFNSLSNLTSITLQNGLLEMDAQIFLACTSLKSIEIPSTVESIASNCFTSSAIEKVVINKEEGSISGEPWGCPIGMRAIKWNG